MRDVGNEVAAHCVKALLLGDVARHHDRVLAVDDDHAQLQSLAARHAPGEGLFKAARLEVGENRLVLDEGKEVPARIGFAADAEDFFGRLVAPGHGPVGLHKHDPFGKGRVLVCSALRLLERR